MRRVTGLTAFDFHRRVFIHEGAGFIGVTFDAANFAAYPAAQLFRLEAAVLVVAIGTLHAAFGNLVMEGTRKRGFLVGVTLVTAFRFIVAQEKFRLFGGMR